MFETTLWKNVPDWWVIHPDHIEKKVQQWQKDYTELLDIHTAKQFTGEKVFALTITDPSVHAEQKKAAVFLNVHTMEYGACAGITNFASMLLTGKDLRGESAPFDAGDFRRKFIVTLIPDSNPQGKLRIPYAVTDGVIVNNGDDNTVSKLYYGICNSQPFRRCPSWKMSEEHVESVGSIYEKISPDEYVLPDMDERSTVLKMLYGLGYTYNYRMAGHMHQAEFPGIKENCYCAASIEPWIRPELQQLQIDWGNFVIQHWKSNGGRPLKNIDHHKWQGSWVIDRITGCVLKMGIDFTTLKFNCPSLVIETQLNDSKTPPAEQMRLGSAAIQASLEFLEQI